MPIKFRCGHCRQFLGISRSRAGDVVDCPTCGRSVRVPQLDGTVDPLPAAPALDMADSALVSALDQLASIGAESTVNADDSLPAEDAAVPESVAPIPEPVAIQPVSPVEGMAVPPPLPAEPASAEIPGRTSVVSAAKPVVVEDELEVLAARSVPGVTGDGRVVERPGRRSVLLRTAVVYGGILGIGVFIGRWSTSQPELTATTPSSNSRDGEASPQRAADVALQPLVRVPADGGQPAVRGRVTWQTLDGNRRPDRGARVIVLPQERVGKATLSIVGFRASDDLPDLQLATAGVRTLGGDVAVVSDSGEFEIRLPAAGVYRVLILSRFQERGEGQEISPAVRAFLDEYFDRGDELLGQLAFSFSQLRYKGEDTEIRDHLFDRAG